MQETPEDEAVNRVIEQAAVEAVARTAQSNAPPDVTMREGQKQFAAASETGAKEVGEPVTTEAAVVAPAKGVEAGDRQVDAKPKKAKKAKKTTAAKTAKVSECCRTRLVSSVFADHHGFSSNTFTC